MIKGFISYKSSKIAFVIENFRMELFSENNNLLDSFINEYKFSLAAVNCFDHNGIISIIGHFHYPEEEFFD